MRDFPIHTIDSAPEASRPTIESAREAFGFVPNLIGMLAEAPAAAAAYLDLGKHLTETSLSPVEQQVVLLAVSHENRCEYCMAAHTVVAKLSGVAADVVDSLRSGTPTSDPRLEALARFTRLTVRQRGHLPNSEIDAFIQAGSTRAQILEVVLGIAMKTLSNHANHLARTPVDQAFSAAHWEPAEAVAV